MIRVPAGHPVLHGSLSSHMCGATHRGCHTIVSRVRRAHGTNHPMLINAASMRVSRLLDGVLGVHGVPRGMLGTGLRRRRTRVMTRTNHSMGNGNTMAVTAGVTNHNASVGLAPRIGTTNNLTVVNARHRRDHHISHRLHNHTKHRNSPNSSIFCMSLRSGLVHLFTSRHVTGMVSHLNFRSNRHVRDPVVDGDVRHTRHGIRRGGFNVHGRLLRCSSIVGHRHAIVCRGHHRTLVNRHVNVSVTGMV